MSLNNKLYENLNYSFFFSFFLMGDKTRAQINPYLLETLRNEHCELGNKIKQLSIEII